MNQTNHDYSGCSEAHPNPVYRGIGSNRKYDMDPDEKSL